MDVFEAISTTRAMRRLDNLRPVADADLRRILEAASKAATGGNAQRTRWLVVRDPELKQKIGGFYRAGAEIALNRYEEEASTDPAAARMLSSARHLADNLGEAPLLVLACGPAGSEASVFPGVQNLMLAARALGLGTTLTTIHRVHEAEIKQLLGVPDPIALFALIPVGYPLGKWGEAKRRPLGELVYTDRWEQTSS